MDYLTLRKHVAWLAKALEDRPVIIRGIDLPGRSFSLRLKRREGPSELVFCLDAPAQSLWLAENSCEIERASSLVRTINRLLINGRLTRVSLAGSEAEGRFDRVVKLQVTVIDSFFGNRSDFFILAEFTGRIADIFICDSDLKILDRLSRSSNNMIGATYSLPDASPSADPVSVSDEELNKIFAGPPESWKTRLGIFSPQLEAELIFRSGKGASPPERAAMFRVLVSEAASEQQLSVYLKNGRCRAVSCFRLGHLSEQPDLGFASVNAALNWLEQSQSAPGRLKETIKQVVARFQRDLRQKQDLLEEQQRLHVKFSGADHLQNLGNLLVANIYRIRPGSKSVELEDWQTGKSVMIELDPTRTPAANATRYFSLYKKARRGLAEVEKRIQTIRAEMAWLHEQIWLAENASNEADLPCEEKKYRARRGSGQAKEPIAGRKGRAALVKPDFEIDGCRYYVGRNARQNDVLTFQVARRGDWWFHANDVPGAHVILKKAEGSVSEVDLWRGAVLAAWFSFARNSSKVAVDATEAANVKRIPGGMPGRVSFTGQHTILVNPADCEKFGLNLFKDQKT